MCVLGIRVQAVAIAVGGQGATSQQAPLQHGLGVSAEALTP